MPDPRHVARGRAAQIVEAKLDPRSLAKATHRLL
jgi:hypothetical protein